MVEPLFRFTFIEWGDQQVEATTGTPLKKYIVLESNSNPVKILLI
jgi:hypothetical protein